MFVVCPKCSAKYQIPTEINLKPGQKLQCSVCQHTFYWTGEAGNEVSQKSDDTISVSQQPQPAETVRPTLNPKPVIPALTVEDETNLLPTTEVSQTLPEAFRPLKPLKHSSFSPLWVVLSFVLVGGIVYLAWQHRDLLMDYLPDSTRMTLPRAEVKAVPSVPTVVESVPAEPKTLEVKTEVQQVPAVVPVKQPQKLKTEEVKTDNRVADRKHRSYQPPRLNVKENSMVPTDDRKVQLPSDSKVTEPVVVPSTDKVLVATPVVTKKVEPAPVVKGVVSKTVAEKAPAAKPVVTKKVEQTPVVKDTVTKTVAEKAPVAVAVPEVKTPVVQPVVEKMTDTGVMPVVEPKSVQTENVATPKVFSFQSIRFRSVDRQGQSSVLIEGFVHNDSETQQSVPETLVATAYNAQGAPLFTKEIFMPKGVLNPKERKPFFGTYAPASKDIQWIDVSVKE